VVVAVSARQDACGASARLRRLMNSTVNLWHRLSQLGELRVSSAAGAPAPDPRLRAGALARDLMGMELGRGDRVAVVLPNGPEFVAALLACLQLEITFVPLNPTATDDELDRRCRTAGVTGILDAAQGLRRAAYGKTVDSAGCLPATILFTSGSGGDARAVALSESSLMEVADTHHRTLAYSPGAVIVGFLPWSHAFGFTLELLMGLLHGGKLQSVPPASFPEVFLTSASEYLFAVPRMVERLDNRSLSRLRGGIVGGTPVRGTIRKRLQKTQLRVGYGQTECGPGVTLGEAGEWEHDNFLGRPVGCELTIRPGFGEDAGELLVRGPNVAMGYLHAEKLVPVVLKDGWRETGDLATRLGDGFIFQGRTDELFKLDNGRMVNPVPLELPYDGRVLLIGEGREAVQPLVRGELPQAFTLPVPHRPPRLMPEAFWTACTTETGKISRRRAQALFYEK
jgi:long-subunit acyl-CoA synthetase (AMP-forming)